MRSEKIFLLRCLGEDLENVFQTRGIPFRYDKVRLTGEGTVPVSGFCFYRLCKLTELVQGDLPGSQAAKGRKIRLGGAVPGLPVLLYSRTSFPKVPVPY
mgnify:CR=1 FL=1